MKQFNEEQVKAELPEYYDAGQLLLEHRPLAQKKFEKACRDLGRCLEYVGKVFPGAHYYTSDGDGIVLMLGRTHGDDENPQQELIALDGTIFVNIHGGAW